MDGCIPCQIACVVKQIGSSRGTRVIVRPCVDVVSDENDMGGSYMVTIWRKTYRTGRYTNKGAPLFCVVSPSELKGQVYCFEDFPTQFGSYQQFEQERKEFMNRYLLKEFTNKSWSKGIQYIGSDWVYRIADKKE